MATSPRSGSIDSTSSESFDTAFEQYFPSLCIKDEVKRCTFMQHALRALKLFQGVDFETRKHLA
jgi:hypothetical protein